MDSTDAIVARLKAALPVEPEPNGVVTVAEADLRRLLTDMPCATCVFVQSVKDQAASIRSLWETLDTLKQANNAAILRRDQRIQELHDQCWR